MSVTKEQVPGIPDGWELVRIGSPNRGEWAIGGDGKPFYLNQEYSAGGLAIIRKIPVWRPAGPSDLGAGQTRARCRDHLGSAWEYGNLAGYRFESEYPFLLSISGVYRAWFKYCEVME